MAERSRSRLGLIVGVGSILLAALAIAALAPHELLVSRIATLESGGLVLLGILLAYVLRPLVFGPMSIITVFVGFRFGVGLGLFVAILGTVLSTLPPYVFARRYGRQVGVFQGLGRSGIRAIRVTGELRSVVSARLSPVPADPVSYGAGFSNVAVGSYVLGTIIGELPWALAFLYLGDSLQRWSTSSATIDLRLIAVFSLGAALLLAGPTYRYVRRHR